MPPQYEDDECCECECCDTFCEAICGDDDDECCECCLDRCCGWMPGCQKGSTPACEITGKGSWCVRRDFCGLVCAGISLFVILMTHWTVVGYIIIPFFRWSIWGYVHLFLFSATVFLAFSSHIVCMTTCPGFMPRGVVSKAELEAQGNVPRGTRGVVAICRKCENYKLKGVHHCSTCNLCVERMDHHCPWVNNCVGRYNQKFFVLFLFYVMLGESYGLLLFVSRLFYCMTYPTELACGGGKDPARLESLLSQVAVVLCVVVGFISALFLCFVSAIGSEQWEAIRDDLPKIDRLQKKQVDADREETVFDGLVVIMGEEFNVRWLLPVAGGQLLNPAAEKGTDFITAAATAESAGGGDKKSE